MRAVATRSPLHRQSELPGWLPLLCLPAAVVLTLHAAQPWLFMWSLSAAIFAGFKWLTWWHSRSPLADASPCACVPATAWRGLRSLAYLLLWPGMDAATFLNPAAHPATPALREWVAAALKTLVGAVLFFGVARLYAPASLLAAGWIGLFGLIFLLHFGSFHLVSLGELWSRRWNLAFHVLARDLVVAAVRGRLGTVGTTVLAFGASGLLHDLVISVPAGGGYGLPTAYLLLQGMGVLFERSRLGALLGLRRGPWARSYVLVVAGLPAFWLFHPTFVLRVIVPFMRAMGAL